MDRRSSITRLLVLALLFASAALAGPLLIFSGKGSSGFSNTLSLAGNGSNKAVSLGTGLNAGLSATSTYSLSVWVKPTSQPGAAVLMDNMVTGSGYRGVVWLLFGSGGIQFQLSNGAGSTPYMRTATGAVPNGSWSHLVVTFDGSGNISTGTVMYVNAVSKSLSNVGTTVAGNTTSAGPLRLMGETGAGNGYLNGLMDEPSIWNKVLSQAEVTELYNAGHAGNLANHSATANIRSWYRMGDLTDSATTVFDRKGANDGTGANLVSGDFTADVP